MQLCIDAAKDTESSQSEEVDFFRETVYPILNKKENFIAMQEDSKYFESLQWENELMNVAVSVDKGLEVLKNNNSVSFTGEETKWCNFIVLECSPLRKTKSGNNYYEAVLMDVSGNLIARRFSEPITAPYVKVYVHSNEERYYVTKCDKYAPRPLERGDYNLDEVSFVSRLKEHTSIPPERYFRHFTRQPDETHTKRVISDATGTVWYMTEKQFKSMIPNAIVYPSNFKEQVAECRAAACR